MTRTAATCARSARSRGATAKLRPTAARSSARRLILTAATLLSSAIGADPGAAQQGPAPFSTLHLSAGPVADFDVGELGDLWNPKHGFLLELSTPFYLGSATLGVQSSSFEARSIEQPDFQMRTFTLAWDGEVDLPLGVAGRGGLHVGAAAMHFLEREETLNHDENEFLTGAQAGLRIPLTGRLALTGTAAHRKVFTRIPLRISTVSLALGYTLPTPAVLREVLE